MIDSDMRLRIKQSRPQNLNEAIRLAEEFDAYYKTEKKSHIRAFDSHEQAKTQTANSNDLYAPLQRMQNKPENLEKQVQRHTNFSKEPF